jgi:SAM-dependent methyltransferase
LVDDLRSRRPDIPLHVGDAADPPATLLGRFDVAVGFFFLHHVADLASILSGVRATLKPGGRIAFLEPNPFYPGYYVQIALTPGMTWRGERGILRMRAAAVGPAAAAVGLRLVEDGAFGAVPPVLANREWGRRMERAVERLPRWDRVGAFRLMVLE